MSDRMEYPGVLTDEGTRRDFLRTTTGVAVAGLGMFATLTLPGCGKGKEETVLQATESLFHGEFQARRVETGIVGGLNDGALTAINVELEISKPGTYRIEFWSYCYRAPDRQNTKDARDLVVDQVPYKIILDLTSNFDRMEVVRISDGKTIERGTLKPESKFQSNGSAWVTTGDRN